MNQLEINSKSTRNPSKSRLAKLALTLLTATTMQFSYAQTNTSGMVQNETPITESERASFEFQPVENDTSLVTFTNSIYPNPFNNKLIVNSLEDDIFEISTLTGDAVKQISVRKGINNISAQDLPKGLYFGKLKNQQFITKLERL